MQGGTGKRSHAYIVLDLLGRPVVNTGKRLYVFFNKTQARAYQRNNRPGSRIIRFRVKKEFADRVAREAVEQAQGRTYPNSPQKSDAHYPDGYGLPRPWVDSMIENAIPNTEGIVPPVTGNIDDDN